MRAETAPAYGAGLVPADLVERLVRRVVAGPRAEQQTVHAPFTGAPLAALPLSTPEDVGVAYAAARGAQRDWSRRTPHERAAIVLRFHDLVFARQAEVLDLVQAESGKARKHAFEEVAEVGIVARHYARSAASYLRSRRRGGMLPLVTKAVEHHHPKGVVGVVSPWNYPLTLGVSDCLPALLAGNAVVHKPDTQTALTALWGHELLVEAGLPKQLWQIVVGDGPVVGGAVVDGADYVCFTGSTAVGREVAHRTAERLVGCSLELGGKNPALVLDDADVDRAAEGLVRGCFSNAGQLCVSIERVYVADEVYDAFVSRFVDRVRGMRLGAGLDFAADMGSLISAQQLDTVMRHVEDARAKGARVLTGGRARPDIGPLFYEPTVLEGVTPDMVCGVDETFGPVVSVYRVGSDDEAVARANDSAYGLNASVWSRDTRRGEAVARRLEAGTVNVNEAYAAAWGSVAAPMGGMKDSGLGRRHGAEGILKYTEAQTVATQRVLGAGAPRGLSDEQWARALTVVLRAIKKAQLR